MTLSTYMAPSLQLKALNLKVNAGDVLDPAALGLVPHPTYGAFLAVEVLEAKADGSIFLLAKATCPECGESFLLHPGDWFQKRACNACAKKARRPSAKLTEEQKAANKAERDAKASAKKAATALEKAEAAAKAAQAAAEAKQAALAKMKAEAEARRALIEQVAAEKGVAVSAKAS